MEHIYLGTIVNPRGFKGEMKLDDVMPNCPIIPEGMEVFIGYSPNFSQKFIVEEWKNAKFVSYAKIRGVNSDDKVYSLKEHGIFIDEEKFNSIMDSDEIIIKPQGILVYDNATGELIGEVIEEWELPANNVWFVQTEDGKLPIPKNEHFIASIDKINNTARINVIEGLMDLLERDE